jgi:uncharacterized membrane protein (UPF0127 family)
MRALAVAMLTSSLLAGCNRSSPSAAPLTFASVAFTVTPDGSSTPAGRWCAYLADTAAKRARGLMETTDLRHHRGMVFRFDADTSAQFYMKDTPMPLSIAWFAADGSFVGQADMKPCLKGGKCPLYAAPKAYRTALEVPQGGLAGLGIGPDSTLRVGGSCDRG